MVYHQILQSLTAVRFITKDCIGSLKLHSPTIAIISSNILTLQIQFLRQKDTLLYICDATNLVQQSHWSLQDSS